MHVYISIHVYIYKYHVACIGIAWVQFILDILVYVYLGARCIVYIYTLSTYLTLCRV